MVDARWSRLLQTQAFINQLKGDATKGKMGNLFLKTVLPSFRILRFQIHNSLLRLLCCWMMRELLNQFAVCTHR